MGEKKSLERYTQGLPMGQNPKGKNRHHASKTDNKFCGLKQRNAGKPR